MMDFFEVIFLKPVIRPEIMLSDCGMSINMMPTTDISAKLKICLFKQKIEKNKRKNIISFFIYIVLYFDYT